MRGPIELLQASWSLVQEHWKLFFGIFLVPGIVSALFDYLTATDDKAASFMQNYPLGFFALLVVFVALLILMNVAMYKAVASPKETTIKSAYEFAKKYFVQYVILSIFVGVVVMLGFVALIVPGIIFAVWFGFSYFILVFEDKKGIDAMKASKAYVKGHWWAIFGRILALGAVLLLLSIVTGVVGYMLTQLFLPSDLATAVTSFVTSAIAMPIAVAYTYFLYNDLKKVNAGASAVTFEEKTPTVPPTTSNEASA